MGRSTCLRCGRPGPALPALCQPCQDLATPSWVPVLASKLSGSLWCTECDAPYVSCGSEVHNPNHLADLARTAR